MMMDPESSIVTLKKLRDLGVMIAIDDFGTGHSSLVYLRRLPVNELKIDKSFVMGLTENEEDVGIVRTIIDLAHSFGLTVTAEGVEDQECLTLLSQLGCDYAQGFFVGEPMSSEDMAFWLNESIWSPNGGVGLQGNVKNHH